jgi:rare lipoprotein A
MLYSCAGPRYREIEYGIASWYGSKFHGRPTASGEIYDMYDMTAAHNSLPLGSRVMVTNLENGRSVEVTINDRGPFVPGRIIDLSYAAAKALDMDSKGLAMVKIEPINIKRIKRVKNSYAIQIGSFIKRGNAERLKSELEESYEDVYISEFNMDGDIFYRVRVGNYNSMKKAYKMAEKLSYDGYTVLIISNP